MLQSFLLHELLQALAYVTNNILFDFFTHLMQIKKHDVYYPVQPVQSDDHYFARKHADHSAQFELDIPYDRSLTVPY